MRNAFFFIGGIAAMIGFLGAREGSRYIELNYPEAVGSAVMHWVGASDMVTAKMKLAAVFSEYGVAVGLGGLGLMVLATLLRGR